MSAEKSGIEEFELPKTCIQKLMKDAKDCKLAVTRAATVFLSYMASNANDITKAHKHKIIQSGDVIKALETSGFGDFIPELNERFSSYQKIQNSKKHTKLQPGDGEDAKLQPGEGEEAAKSKKHELESEEPVSVKMLKEELE